MKSLALALLFLPGSAFAGPWYELVNGTMSLTGVLGIAASSSTPKNYVLLLNGRDGYIQFPDGTRQTTAGVAASTITVNASQFSGNGGSGSPLTLLSSSVTLQGNSISIAGLKGRIDNLDVTTATLTTGLAGKVSKSGDTMTGQLNVSSNVVSSSSMTANYFQGGGANFTLPVTGVSLSEIEDLTANKTFTMANKTLTWNFTNPSGGMAWNFTGAAAGHSLEIAQSGGNPGTDMHLLHIHAEDPDPTILHLIPGAATSRALLVHANGDTVTNPGRFEMTGAGSMAWGTGAGATDTTLARTGIAALQTNAALTAASFIGPLTGNASTVTNGVYTNGSYANPSWITSLATSKIDLSTVTTALAGKLSNTATVPTSLIDLSTVTTALAGKQATGNYITALTGNVTASGPGSAAATIVSVPQSAVNLSTVTTALAAKANTADVIPSTATGTYALSTTGRAALATSADNATTVTNGAYVNASNYFTGVNQFTLNTTISNKLYVDEIQLSSAVPSIKAYDGASIKNILMYPGVEINSSPGYAYNWILASTDSLKMKYYDAGPDVGQYFKYDKYGLVTSSGIRAGASRVDGSGGVNIIGSDGRIPALTSTYIANLDGTAITGVTDSSKVAKAGDTISGQLTVSGSSITIASDLLDYQLILTGANKRNMKFDNRHASASTHNLAEIDFLQLGTLKHQISAYGDTNATYPQELQLGSPSGTASKVRITGSATLNPDIFVSSFGSVGINTAAPNTAYKLDVNGNVRASIYYGDGSQLTNVVGSGAQGLLASTNTWTARQEFKTITSTSSCLNSDCRTSWPSGDVVLASTQIFSGGNALLGSTTFYGNINLPIRSKINFSNSIHNISTAAMTPTSYTGGTFAGNNCVTGSTLTITTNGGDVLLWLHAGALVNTGGGYKVVIGIKSNNPSVFPTNYLWTHAFVYGGEQEMVEFQRVYTPVPAGTYTVCLIPAVQSGAQFTIPSSGGTYPIDTNQFGIMELR